MVGIEDADELVAASVQPTQGVIEVAGLGTAVLCAGEVADAELAAERRELGPGAVVAGEDLELGAAQRLRRRQRLGEDLERLVQGRHEHGHARRRRRHERTLAHVAQARQPKGEGMEAVEEVGRDEQHEERQHLDVIGAQQPGEVEERRDGADAGPGERRPPRSLLSGAAHAGGQRVR